MIFWVFLTVRVDEIEDTVCVVLLRGGEQYYLINFCKTFQEFGSEWSDVYFSLKIMSSGKNPQINKHIKSAFPMTHFQSSNSL